MKLPDDLNDLRWYIRGYDHGLEAAAVVDPEAATAPLRAAPGQAAPAQGSPDGSPLSTPGDTSSRRDPRAPDLDARWHKVMDAINAGWEIGVAFAAAWLDEIGLSNTASRLRSEAEAKAR